MSEFRPVVPDRLTFRPQRGAVLSGRRVCPSPAYAGADAGVAQPFLHPGDVRAMFQGGVGAGGGAQGVRPHVFPRDAELFHRTPRHRRMRRPARVHWPADRLSVPGYGAFNSARAYASPKAGVLPSRVSTAGRFIPLTGLCSTALQSHG